MKNVLFVAFISVFSYAYTEAGPLCQKLTDLETIPKGQYQCKLARRFDPLTKKMSQYQREMPIFMEKFESSGLPAVAITYGIGGAGARSFWRINEQKLWISNSWESGSWVQKPALDFAECNSEGAIELSTITSQKGFKQIPELDTEDLQLFIATNLKANKADATRIKILPLKDPRMFQYVVVSANMELTTPPHFTPVDYQEYLCNSTEALSVISSSESYRISTLPSEILKRSILELSRFTADEKFIFDGRLTCINPENPDCSVEDLTKSDPTLGSNKIKLTEEESEDLLVFLTTRWGVRVNKKDISFEIRAINDVGNNQTTLLIEGKIPDHFFPEPGEIRFENLSKKLLPSDGGSTTDYMSNYIKTFEIRGATLAQVREVFKGPMSGKFGMAPEMVTENPPISQWNASLGKISVTKMRLEGLPALAGASIDCIVTDQIECERKKGDNQALVYGHFTISADLVNGKVVVTEQGKFQFGKSVENFFGFVSGMFMLPRLMYEWAMLPSSLSRVPMSQALSLAHMEKLPIEHSFVNRLLNKNYLQRIGED